MLGAYVKIGNLVNGRISKREAVMTGADDLIRAGAAA